MLVKEEKLITPLPNDNAKNELSYINEKILMEELRRLDNAYKAIKSNRLDEYISSLPKSIELERKSYDAPSDEVLSQQAQDYYAGEYLEGKNKLMDNIESAREELLSNKEKLNKAQRESLENLESNYQRVKENISNQALKRGLGRSSIVFNKLSEIELGKAEQAGIIEKDTRDKIMKIESDIENLSNTYQDSLQAFDLKHAAKVMKEMQSLIKERDKIAKEVLEYNNKVTEKEIDFENKRAEQIDKYKDKLKQDDIKDEEYFQNYGYYPDAKRDYQDRYSLAYDFYMDMPKKTALRMFNSNQELEKYLGNKYYNQLKTVLAMRS